MMRARARTILETVIRDYIHFGRPITSERLFEAYDFGIKPAMIRWELQSLADAGFLYQTRPSGGRFPTHKAYRFFVERLLEDEPWPDGAPRDFSTALAVFSRGARRPLIEEIAGYLKVLGVGYEPESEFVYESGLRELLAHLEFEGRRELMDVIRDFDLLPGRLGEKRAWWEREENWPQVFVGASPVTRSPSLSVVAAKMTAGRRPFLLLAIGPTRMDYEKSLGLFRSLMER